jgi:hypothetical protein
MTSGEELPAGDPRILESPVEASLELADLSARRLPALKLRSARLLSLGALLSSAAALMAALTIIQLVDAMEAGARLLSMAGLAYVSLCVLFLPSIGLGVALVMLAAKERQFLPFLEKASGAMTAIEGQPPERPVPAGAGAASSGGSPLALILGSAISVGSLVPTVERMAAVGRGVLVLLALGLVALPALAGAGLVLGTFSVPLVSLELVLLVVLAVPVAWLFRDLSGDLRFYRYYSRRQRAIAEAAAAGPAPVPEGPDALARFDRHLRSAPQFKALLAARDARAEDSPEGAAGARLYSGDGAGILVRPFERPPGISALEALLGEAGALAGKRGLYIFRAVALVGPGGPDLDNATYDHVIGLGERTRPGGCALQLVMEVEGVYSMVPFVGG